MLIMVGRSARMSQPIHSLRFNKPYNLISQEYFEVGGWVGLQGQPWGRGRAWLTVVIGRCCWW